MTTFSQAVRDVQLEQLLEECEALRLDDGETASVLALYDGAPWLLDLQLARGGSIRTFIAGRLEIRRTLRALD